jgi:anaerobic selenocysteine-containing dehydrogenase
VVVREQVPTFCPLCVSKCGAIATVEGDRLLGLAPDPSHPTGQALCVKGKAAPELVHHRDRVLRPLKRTAPKGAADPAWQPITWDEALDTVAARVLATAEVYGHESVVFASASPSPTAMSDSIDWLIRLGRGFGTPNLMTYMELCGWGRYGAPLHTFGAPVPGVFMPDLDNAGCILFWGYNPSVARLAHATATTAALRRGARLVVVDPRRVGLASRADHWLRVRPGSDAALAIAMSHVLLTNGWYDEEFVRRWTNAPMLVRDDTGQLLRAVDVFPGTDGYVAWDAASGAPVPYDPKTGGYGVDVGDLALSGAVDVVGIGCRPVFELLVESCAAMAPTAAAEVTGVSAEQIEAAARTLWESRPVAFYTWSGVEQHSNATQTVRAIDVLYALTGSLDVPGGNVAFTPVPTNPPSTMLASTPQDAIGAAERPLGAGPLGHVTGADFYAAALDGRARALVNFGANLTLAHGNSARGRAALAQLDFFVHADLFLNPTAELADIVLPVTSAWESDALRVGFETSQAAQSRVQLRRRLVPPRGEARSDLQIIFDLAVRLGLGDQFASGDIEAAWRHQLAPSGVALEELRSQPAGVDVALTTRYRKYETRGFDTPTRKVELYAERFLDVGQPPLPAFVEPALSPQSRPDLASRFPLVLTCTKSLWFGETQHRNIAALRRSAPDPQLEIHPDTAAQRGIAAGDWVRITTPLGSIRARAKLVASLDPGVVCGQHGWWQACSDLDLPGYPPFAADGANLNLILAQEPADPVSGSSPLRSTVCEVSPLT